jgi:hypothetical protein
MPGMVVRLLLAAMSRHPFRASRCRPAGTAYARPRTTVTRPRTECSSPPRKRILSLLVGNRTSL